MLWAGQGCCCIQGWWDVEQRQLKVWGHGWWLLCKVILSRQRLVVAAAPRSRLLRQGLTVLCPCSKGSFSQPCLCSNGCQVWTGSWSWQASASPTIRFGMLHRKQVFQGWVVRCTHTGPDEALQCQDHSHRVRGCDRDADLEDGEGGGSKLCKLSRFSGTFS